MATPEDLRRLVAYDRAVYFRFLRAVERLPKKEQTRNRETGHRTLRATLLHILHVRDGWLNYIVPGLVDELRRGPRIQDESLTSMMELRAYADSVWAGNAERAAGLTERSLRRTVKAPWMPGRYRVEDAFRQASFEQAHHLGEIIAVFWQMDRKPPEMTWIDVNRDDRPLIRAVRTDRRAQRRG